MRSDERLQTLDDTGHVTIETRHTAGCRVPCVCGPLPWILKPFVTTETYCHIFLQAAETAFGCRTMRVVTIGAFDLVFAGTGNQIQCFPRVPGRGAVGVQSNVCAMTLSAD